MQPIQTPIIPRQPTFAKVVGPHQWNKEGICVFAATGFFFYMDKYWKDEVVLPPASQNEFNAQGVLTNSTPWFRWHYTPRDISFEKALDEFTHLFESIMASQVANRKVILPISGGLDSRTQAAALHYLKKEVVSYSYKFEGGYNETAIARKIAAQCHFAFEEFTISKGYLWEHIESLAALNKCYSEFTHPRQMAIIDKFEGMGEVFSLGHWGDVLFDRGAPAGTRDDQALLLIKKKVIKKGGMELATAMWNFWKLPGTFEAYLDARLQSLWERIPIDQLSAKMRAFKSLYWAPRWTSVNLSIFEAKKPITLPYYTNEMCEFICTIPEAYLADRKLQIAYIMKRNPKLARITWEEKKPFHLYNYHLSKVPYNLPYRAVNKAKRAMQGLSRKPFVQRNWELQFLGPKNDALLQEYLFHGSLKHFLDESVISHFYHQFLTQDKVAYSHPLSILLTLALRLKLFEDEKED